MQSNLKVFCVLNIKSRCAAWNIFLLIGIFTGLSMNVAIVAIEGIKIGQSRCVNVIIKLYFVFEFLITNLLNFFLI